MWHCPAEGEDIRAPPGQVGLLRARCQAAPASLSQGCCVAVCGIRGARAQPSRAMASVHRGGRWQLPLTRSSAAAVSLLLAMCSSNLPRPRMGQQCPYPPLEQCQPWGTPEPSKRLSLQIQNIFYVDTCSEDAATSAREGALAGPVPPFLLMAMH